MAHDRPLSVNVCSLQWLEPQVKVLTGQEAVSLVEELKEVMARMRGFETG